MQRSLLELYWLLPPLLRNAAAGWQGMRLHRRRYGSETDDLADAFNDAERRPQYHEAALAEALWGAARSVPYYRELWISRRRRGSRLSVERLENWPLLDKDSVRRNPESFVADDAWRRPHWIERTSGTTGTPLKLYRSRRTLRARYALYEARHRRWYGVSREEPWAMAGGQLVARQSAVKPPFWVWNRPMRQLYVSSYHLAPKQAAESLAAIAARRCHYLWGYSSSLAALAASALEHGIELPLAVTIANAEPLPQHQRSTIEAAFRAPCRETYGMVELAAGGGECEAGRLHLFPELGHVELLDGGAPAAAGEIIATSLLDADMPLIRYRTGDRGGPLEPKPCPCGRTLPVIRAIEGRSDDLLYSRDGRPVGRLDPVFKGDAPIRESQILQAADGSVRVLVVAAPGFDGRAERALVRALQDRLGDLAVAVETVSQIPRGPNGKFRASVSRFRPQPQKEEAVCSSR